MTDVPVGRRSRRRWWWLAAGIVLVVVLAGAVVVTRLSDKPPTEPVAAPCTLPVVPPAPTSSAAQASPSPDAVGGRTQAPSGGAVVVAEQGFSVADDRRHLSFGAVLANTSSEVAYRTRVTVRPYNRKGVLLLGPHSKDYLFEIPVIRPGERVNLGTVVTVDDLTLKLEPEGKGLPGEDLEAARVDVGIVGTRWISAAQGAEAFKPISASFVDASPDPGSFADLAATRFAVDSGYCRALVFQGRTIVMRDSTEKIVGGRHDGRTTAEDLCQPGRAVHRVNVADALYWPSERVDLPKTTMSVYCDVAVAPPLRPKLGEPMN